MQPGGEPWFGAGDVAVDVKIGRQKWRISGYFRDPAWTFGGSWAGPGAACQNQPWSRDLGAYQKTALNGRSGQLPMSGWIPDYDGKRWRFLPRLRQGFRNAHRPRVSELHTVRRQLQIFSYGLQRLTPPACFGVEISDAGCV